MRPDACLCSASGQLAVALQMGSEGMQQQPFCTPSLLLHAAASPQDSCNRSQLKLLLVSNRD